MSNTATREAFFAACHARQSDGVVSKDIPSLGLTLKFRKMTAGTLETMPEGTNGITKTIHVVLSCVLDEHGQPMFTDIQQVRDLSSEVFQELSIAAAEVSKITDAGTLAKN